MKISKALRKAILDRKINIIKINNNISFGKKYNITLRENMLFSFSLDFCCC